ncbi:MAG: Tat pathway signal protein, partial [Asticcacaulis sp.]|nr:Tat pathway signal protein [Asticcacaulis sp.]
QVGQGRLLPSTAVDQMAATLARWFGVADGELPTVLPNIGRFAANNMGYFS